MVSCPGWAYIGELLCGTMCVVSRFCVDFHAQNAVGVWNHASSLELYVVLQARGVRTRGC